MSILNKIIAAAATCKSGGNNFTFAFYHMESEELNRKENGDELENSKVAFPFIFLEFPLTGKIEIVKNSNGRLLTNYRLRIFFGNVSKLSNNQRQRNTNVYDMELAANEFISALYSNDQVEIIGDPEITQTIEAFDFSFSVDGVYLNMQVKAETTPAC